MLCDTVLKGIIPLAYLGSCQDGGFVWHVFEESGR